MEDIRFHGDNLVRLEDVVCKINSGESGDEILVIDTEMCDIHPEFPIRFDALVIVLIKRVEGYVDVNLQRYDLSPGSLLVLTPKDYISGFSTSNDGCGTVMMCSHNIVETLFPTLNMETLLIASLLSGIIYPYFSLGYVGSIPINTRFASLISARAPSSFSVSK